MTVKSLDRSSVCAKIAARLTVVRCTCGKTLGRGRGYVQMKCNNRKFHEGNKVMVLAEANADKVEIIGIEPIVVLDI